MVLENQWESDYTDSALAEKFSSNAQDPKWNHGERESQSSNPYLILT